MNRWILQISAGTGPTEVRRFVRLLADRLSNEFEHSGLCITSISIHGDEQAPCSVEFELSAPSCAALQTHVGTHVLIARSKTRSHRSRKRSFVGVSVHQAPSAEVSCIALCPRDLEISVARAGGPGGQHVNKSSTAVRILHKPSGISVRAANQRSQAMNRKVALTRLGAILRAREMAAKRNRGWQKRLAHYRFERGRAVRTWRLDTNKNALICD